MKLEDIPAKYASPDPATLAKLPKPYKKDSEKGTCKECGGYHGLPAMHLDYMGHAEVTLALIEADPDWTWEPLVVGATGPVITKEGTRLVMWARLTILGKSIIGVGTCGTGQGDPEKELIGDFLRNAAMRFGIGTKLWSKAIKADPAGRGSAGGYDEQPARQPAPKSKTPGMLLFDRLTGQSPETQAALRKAKENFKDAKLTAASFDADDAWHDAVMAILAEAPQ